MLRIYQILIAIIFIVVPFLLLLFFLHILKTLFHKIAIIFKILVENNIGQFSNNEMDNLRQVKSMTIDQPIKKVKIKTMKNSLAKTLSQNANLNAQQNVLTLINKQSLDKIDLENKRNNDTINSDKEKENGQYSIGSIIYIENVAYDIIKFQKQVKNGKSTKIVLARNSKTGEIINFPYQE